jgi:hypothetical protein
VRAVMSRHLRRDFLLARLREADGISYDELCRAVAEAIPSHSHWAASARGVKVVRMLLWDGLATTEPDESVWLTPKGWQAAGRAS